VSKVLDLINPVTDEELIRENFWTIIANRILEIPIAPLGMQDFVAWHLTKTSLFTVSAGA
jgi:hypothetical protein